MSTQGMLLDTN